MKVLVLNIINMIKNCFLCNKKMVENKENCENILNNTVNNNGIVNHSCVVNTNQTVNQVIGGDNNGKSNNMQ